MEGLRSANSLRPAPVIKALPFRGFPNQPEIDISKVWPLSLAQPCISTRHLETFSGRREARQTVRDDVRISLYLPICRVACLEWLGLFQPFLNAVSSTYVAQIQSLASCFFLENLSQSQ
jgi:hypothetical protein